MQIIRTIVWIAITAALVAFMAMNWDQAPVNFWPVENGAYLHLQWPVGLIAMFFFLVGALPTWLLAKAGRWRMNRRMSALENSVRAVTPTMAHAVTQTPPHAAVPMSPGDVELSPADQTGIGHAGAYPAHLKEG